MATSSDLQIEDLLNGIATGNYVAKVGSKFGSWWEWDGLVAAEATPEQYAAFGAASSVKLGHAKPVIWQQQQWSVILVYQRGLLAQVSINTERNEKTSTAVSHFLTNLLGKGQEVQLPQDAAQSVTRRVLWQGKDGEAWAVYKKIDLQISIQRFTRFRRFVSSVLRLFWRSGPASN